MKEDPDRRSRTMRAVKARDTEPELIVRRMIFAMGFRYRLHRKDLPGRPDIALVARRKVIFVHGCFWHGHDCSRGARIPKSNTDYWTKKINANRARDAKNISALKSNNWKTLVVWECELRKSAMVSNRLKRFLLE